MPFHHEGEFGQISLKKYTLFCKISPLKQPFHIKEKQCREIARLSSNTWCPRQRNTLNLCSKRGEPVFQDSKLNTFGGPISRNDTYFDTANLDLLAAGMCFRIGGKGERTVRITFKEGTADPRERIEIQDILTSTQATAALRNGYPSRVIDAVRASVGRKTLIAKLRVYSRL